MPAPTVTITLDDYLLSASDTPLVRFVFSETVKDFALDDVIADNGTLTNLFTADNTTYTATFTPSPGVSAPANVITVDMSGVMSNANEPGVGTTRSAEYAIDSIAPVVNSVAVPAPRTYGVGEPLDFTVAWNEGIIVDTSGGTPRIELTVGSSTVYATYAGGSGTSMLVFSYVVTNGAQDANGITVGALQANGGTLKDMAGNDAGLMLNSIGGTAGVLVDGVAPPAPSAPDLVAASDTGASDTDNITRDTTPTFTGTAEAGATVTLYDSDGVTVLGMTTAAGGAWSITSSPLSAGPHTVTAVATDAAGNASPVSAGLVIIIEADAPPPPPPPPIELIGGPGADTIIGNERDNRIEGLGGDDSLAGRTGHDSMLGGDGADFLHGNRGRDTIGGGEAADTIYGGQDADFLQGNTGTDSLFGDLGADTLHGGQDADTLQGGQGDDVVLGDLGDDILRGGQGSDLLLGGDGDDFLAGDLGADTLVGGAGADTFEFRPVGGLDRVLDFNAAEGDRVTILDGAPHTAVQRGEDVIISVAGGAEMHLMGVQLSSLPDGWIVST